LLASATRGRKNYRDNGNQDDCTPPDQLASGETTTLPQVSVEYGKEWTKQQKADHPLGFLGTPTPDKKQPKPCGAAKYAGR